MITPKEIRKKAEKKYVAVLRNLIEEIPFEKLVVRCDKSYAKASLPDFEKELLLIRSQSKEKRGYGYSLEFQTVKTKYLGLQDIPTQLFFETETDFFRYLGKEKEAKEFQTDSSGILAAFPELTEWMAKNPAKVIQHHKDWPGLLRVCQYFTENPRPHLYVRELPIPVHTKFIETHKGIIRSLLDILIPTDLQPEEKDFEKRFNLRYGEPLVRFKVLDSSISTQFFSGVDDLAIPVSQFEQLELPIEKVIVVENKTSLYTTLTLPNMEKTIAVFGKGFAVHELKRVKWFHSLELLYWGDIDAQGFEILSQFRGYFPHCQSILMDQTTFDHFFENDPGTPTQVTAELVLTHEEQQLYEVVKKNNCRLEQEKIPLDYANLHLRKRILVQKNEE